MGPLAMFFGVASMAASANQTQKINRQIEQHFERMELSDRLLKVNESASGFVFFRIPPATKTLDQLVVEVTLEQERSESERGEDLVYRFVMPPLAAR
jgi:hypothetical protein